LPGPAPLRPAPPVPAPGAWALIGGQV